MIFSDLDLDERLLIARRGTSYFAQRLAELTDEQLDEPSLLEGWSRKHLVAHVGYNAAALCRLLDWAATGVETPMYGSPEQRAQEIAEGATLTAAALRNLFAHTVARLDEKWRNLPDDAWSEQVRTAQGRTVPVSETAWMRTREVWIHAVDLANGGRFGDFPDVVLDSLLTDIVGMWRGRELGGNELGGGIVVEVDGREAIPVRPVSGGSGRSTSTVVGPLPSVVRWAAGRGGVGLTVGDDVEPPRWL
ncbi:maleylpyruvate isomerase family mycothiol-dependent enzyme [Gordonia humi]|uniref:Maleylpyruvate isomerase n=1 Tax=Gordonia humi TaxID=686429 RepID=A0A840F0T9_9ACTN|nr:maleylpyruvate isomerase family mycothiol-dependent enzyme [Gordonia humi]MBB4137491.1 maleylpyruvate isomerase [Gordonia humi]